MMNVKHPMAMPWLDWRKREDHSDDFRDGEELLVVVDGVISTIEFVLEENTTGKPYSIYVQRYRDHLWEYMWSDVDYWLPLEEIRATIP
jgi:hypothetical protein